VAEYLLFLFIVLVAIAAFINICKVIIESVGEQVVKAIFASKSKIILKNPLDLENNQQ
jgi:hypothetical protein